MTDFWVKIRKIENNQHTQNSRVNSKPIYFMSEIKMLELKYALKLWASCNVLVLVLLSY